MSVLEEPVSDEILGNIRDCAADCLELLGSQFTADHPARLVDAIDNFTYRLQKGDATASASFEDTEDAGLILGSLWGQQLVKQFGWQWAKVTLHDDGNAVMFGVVSPDRSLAIYPFEFVEQCLNDARIDCTIMLSFNMLLDAGIPQMDAGSYTNVMDGIHRIVPRG